MRNWWAIDLAIRREVVVDPIGRTNVVLIGTHIFKEFHVVHTSRVEIGVVRVVLAVHEKGFGFLRRELQGDFLGRVGGTLNDFITGNDVHIGVIVFAPESARTNMAESTASVVGFGIDLNMIDFVSRVPSPGISIVLAASKAFIQFSSFAFQNSFRKERKLDSVV